MRLAHPIGPLRRGAALTLLGVVLSTLALGLSQCRMVDERLTGVSLSSTRPNDCLNACFVDFKAAMAVEKAVHKQEIADCAGDSLCLVLEGQRHAQAVQQIQDNRQICNQNCQHQGSGAGGR